MGKESMERAGPFLTYKRRLKLKTKESKKGGRKYSGRTLEKNCKNRLITVDSCDEEL
jgi:hypothetical protein